ncbi:MAG: extracellular solute-binding protein, partial [bacterium]
MKRFGSIDNPVKYFVFALIAIAVILYFFLPRARKDVEVDPETGEERTVIRYVGGGLGRDRLLWNEIKREFEKTHPHIVLKFVRSFSPRKVDTMIAGGVAPDIISVGSDQVAYYLEAKALADLTDFIRQDPQLYRDLQPGGDFYDIMIEPFRVGERIYMIPIWYTPFVVFY